MNPKLAIIMGSDSDFPVFNKGIQFLKDSGIPFRMEVTSAHRTPERTVSLVREFEEQGIQVIIAAAGGAAHLAGVVAAHTLLPVLAVPISSPLMGLDSLLSMVQMPGGIPVATFGIGESGALNAILFALSIIGPGDKTILDQARKFRSEQAESVLKKNHQLQEKIRNK